ncbi:hypothetical protein ACMHYB_09150 [Sorangium sp. So ce1128]
MTADQLRPGDPYELSEGRPVACMATGRRGGRSNLVGGEVLDTEPAVEAAGVDVGVSPRLEMLGSSGMRFPSRRSTTGAPRTR